MILPGGGGSAFQKVGADPHPAGCPQAGARTGEGHCAPASAGDLFDGPVPPRPPPGCWRAWSRRGPGILARSSRPARPKGAVFIAKEASIPFPWLGATWTGCLGPRGRRVWLLLPEAAPAPRGRDGGGRTHRGGSEGCWTRGGAGRHRAPCRACLSKGPAGPPGARGQQLDPALPPLASCRSHEVPTPRAPTGRRALGRGPAPPRAARPVPRGGRSGAGARRFFPSPSNHRPPLCWRFLSRGQPERLRILDRLSEASGALGKRSERPGLCPSLPSLSAFVPAQPATGDSF